MFYKTAGTFFLLGAVLFCTACKSHNNHTDQTPVIIQTAQTAVISTANRKEFPFIAKPLRISELSFRVSGPIDHFDVYPGNFYKHGSIIAEIDPRDFRLRREQAEATYRQARTEYERIEALYQKNNVSASIYEKTRAEYVAARTAFDKATNDLNDTRLTAPFNGYAGEVFIEKFQDVRASQRVVSLVDISKLKIEVFVPQEIALQAQDLKHVSISFDTQPNKVYAATIAEVSKSTTPNNLSYVLTALLPNTDGKLLSGMSGRMFFDIATSQSNAVSIPQSALCHQPTLGDYVWVVDTVSHKVSRRSITSGILEKNGKLIVTQGLNPEETIAISNLRFLSDGMTVEIEDRAHVQPVIQNAL